jgi:hypothetical protein
VKTWNLLSSEMLRSDLYGGPGGGGEGSHIKAETKRDSF